MPRPPSDTRRAIPLPPRANAPDEPEPREVRAARLRPHVARWVELLGPAAVAARTGLGMAAVKAFVRRRTIPLPGALDAYEEMLEADDDPSSGYADWRPTEVNIAALPPPLRRYIHELQERVRALTAHQDDTRREEP
ncbi:MAG TPA: hypothetical protein VF746_25245 [Longimicrobium sp.]|jgi:hypothetical protein